MKLLVILALVSGLAAAPPGSLREAPANAVQLLRFISDNDGLDIYNFAYEQTDGSKRNEEGEVRNAGTDTESIAVKGSYTWTGPDGNEYTVNYVADENGFKPTIDQPPGGAVPPGVVASLLG